MLIKLSTLSCLETRINIRIDNSYSDVVKIGKIFGKNLTVRSL